MGARAEQLGLRPVTHSDWRTLYDWRNDELTRKMSRNSRLVPVNDHRRWLLRHLHDRHLIAEIDGEPVGVVRIEDGELNYTVSPKHRGRGICTRMLTLVRDKWGPQIANVKSENVASKKAALNAGHVVFTC